MQLLILCYTRISYGQEEIAREGEIEVTKLRSITGIVENEILVQILYVGTIVEVFIGVTPEGHCTINSLTRPAATEVIYITPLVTGNLIPASLVDDIDHKAVGCNWSVDNGK